jgi:hypothetical protein
MTLVQDVRPLQDPNPPPEMMPNGLRLTRTVRVPVKLKILAGLLLVPVCVAIYGAVEFSADDIKGGRDERLGVAYVAPLNALLQEVTKSPPPAAPRGLDALESLTADHDDALHLAPKIAELRKQPTVANVLALYSRVSNSSKLSNDPDLDAHYTVALVMESAPNLAVAAAQLKVARARGLHEAVVKAARTATAVNPALASDLSTRELNEAYERFVAFVDAPRYAPEQIEAANRAGRELSRAALDLAARSAHALDGLLATRLHGFESRRNQLVGMTLLMLLLAIAVVGGASWQWIDSQLREPTPLVANRKAAPEVLWPMATLRARAFIPHRKR